MTSSKGVALVTGASAGIGAVYADRLAKRGHDLVLVACDFARMAQLGERLRSENGVAVEIIPADLTLDSDVTKIEQRLAVGDRRCAGKPGPFRRTHPLADAELQEVRQRFPV
ncbi:SDR family NAD(P)-dependent oxidoreductase [Novosphingobium sp. ST904]|uniref:SDR family NAD(P)-dependent oxidoreductase n=1 Tax=Novosphingobium sp. ST904 TaxID=1684385 RepID=UPI0006C8D4E9|nr:SDR family NAD(P)-dependent oxidoreductase [Novosphingobium sp. ST904]KPH66130.1 hypothetical protein ADT71_07685 [Novosphingobium sp. ST904]TCM27209.1 short subunit dehydrogenase [Novosphingobium sp. ST904]